MDKFEKLAARFEALEGRAAACGFWLTPGSRRLFGEQRGDLVKMLLVVGELALRHSSFAPRRERARRVGWQPAGESGEDDERLQPMPDVEAGRVDWRGNHARLWTVIVADHEVMHAERRAFESLGELSADAMRLCIDGGLIDGRAWRHAASRPREAVRAWPWVCGQLAAANGISVGRGGGLGVVRFEPRGGGEWSVRLGGLQAVTTAMPGPAVMDDNRLALVFTDDDLADRADRVLRSGVLRRDLLELSAEVLRAVGALSAGGGGERSAEAIERPAVVHDEAWVWVEVNGERFEFATPLQRGVIRELFKLGGEAIPVGRLFTRIGSAATTPRLDALFRAKGGKASGYVSGWKLIDRPERGMVGLRPDVAKMIQ